MVNHFINHPRLVEHWFNKSMIIDMLLHKSHPLTYQHLNGVKRNPIPLWKMFLLIWLGSTLNSLIQLNLTRELVMKQLDERGKLSRFGGDFWSCSVLSVGEDWYSLNTPNLMQHVLWKFEQIRWSPVNLRVLVCLEGIPDIDWWIWADWHEVLGSSVEITYWNNWGAPLR